MRIVLLAALPLLWLTVQPLAAADCEFTLARREFRCAVNGEKLEQCTVVPADGEGMSRFNSMFTTPVVTDSSELKAGVHRPVDWSLLTPATRTALLTAARKRNCFATTALTPPAETYGGKEPNAAEALAAAKQLKDATAAIVDSSTKLVAAVVEAEKRLRRIPATEGELSTTERSFTVAFLLVAVSALGWIWWKATRNELLLRLRRNLLEAIAEAVKRKIDLKPLTAQLAGSVRSNSDPLSTVPSPAFSLSDIRRLFQEERNTRAMVRRQRRERARAALRARRGTGRTADVHETRQQPQPPLQPSRVSIQREKPASWSSPTPSSELREDEVIRAWDSLESADEISSMSIADYDAQLFTLLGVGASDFAAQGNFLQAKDATLKVARIVALDNRAFYAIRLRNSDQYLIFPRTRLSRRGAADYNMKFDKLYDVQGSASGTRMRVRVPARIPHQVFEREVGDNRASIATINTFDVSRGVVEAP